MDLTLRDILEYLYDEAYWHGESERRLDRRAEGREAAVNLAEELIEPLRDRPGHRGDFTEVWEAGGYSPLD